MDQEAGQLVLGYRDMWRAERAFRSMKAALRMEPVYHRADRRIVSRAHLCVLAYLLMRIGESRVGQSWPLIRGKVEQVSVGRIQTDHAAIFRVKRLKDSERQIWNSCGLEPSPQTLQVTT